MSSNNIFKKYYFNKNVILIKKITHQTVHFRLKNQLIGKISLFLKKSNQILWNDSNKRLFRI